MATPLSLNERASKCLWFILYREAYIYLIWGKELGTEIEIHILLSSWYVGKVGPGIDIFNLLDKIHDISELDQIKYVYQKKDPLN